MRLLDISNALDGDDVFAIDADEWSKTGVDRSMVDLLRRRTVLGDDLARVQRVSSA